jgi:putative ABC transport system permease protein
LIQVIVWMFPAVPAATPIWAVFSVLGVALFTGVFFGVFPATRAMRLDPIVALSSRA